MAPRSMPGPPPSLNAEGYQVGMNDTSNNPSPAGGDTTRVGPIFLGQSCRERVAASNDEEFRFQWELRHDGSGEYHLRSQEASLVETTRSALLDVTGSRAVTDQGTPAEVRVACPTATPWMSFFMMLGTRSALYMRDSEQINLIRQLPDFLHARIPSAPGATLAEPPEASLCPPEGLAKRVLPALWNIVRANWSRLAGVVLGQKAWPTIQETRDHYRDDTLPPGLYGDGLATPNIAHPLDRRQTVKLPTRPPGLACASDVAGHIGHIVEDHQTVRSRVHVSLNQHQDYRLLTRSFKTAAGGFGGTGSTALRVATSSDPIRYVDDADWQATPSKNSEWRPFMEGNKYACEVSPEPSAGTAYGFGGADPMVLPNAKYNAFAGGNYLRACLSDDGWQGIVQEDFGHCFLHAFGPDGHAAKWVSVFSDSSSCMNKTPMNSMSTPLTGVDQLCCHANRTQLASETDACWVPVCHPYIAKWEMQKGATLEHLATWARDDVMLWAFSYPDYTTYFRTHDTPVGNGLPPLPEAGGNASDRVSFVDPKQARQIVHDELNERLDAILATTDSANEEQRDMIKKIREARACLLADQKKLWRQLNEQIWTFWADSFPAFVKQRHYFRGLMALFWWSSNDIGCGDRWATSLDLRPHQDRAPNKGGRHADNWMPLRRGCPEQVPMHTKVDLSRFLDVCNYYRTPTVMGAGRSDQWHLGAHFDDLNDWIFQQMQSRGVAVLPVDQWVDVLDRKHGGWHCDQNFGV